jgi:hypothetical protein
MNAQSAQGMRREEFDGTLRRGAANSLIVRNVTLSSVSGLDFATSTKLKSVWIFSERTFHVIWSQFARQRE